MAVTAGYVFLVVIGVLTLGGLMWWALLFELLHGHTTKALIILVIILLFGDGDSEDNA